MPFYSPTLLVLFLINGIFPCLSLKREREANLLGILFSQVSGLNDSWTITSEKDRFNHGEKDFEIELHLKLLMIADHSMYEAFLELYRDDFSAYHALSEYLRGLFDQTKTIFHRFVFFEKERIGLKLAGTTIISRHEDCPLKSALLTSGNSTEYEDFKMPSLSFSLKIEALDAIHLLEEWVWEHAAFLPLHDHTVFITKFDLLSSTNESSTQGMAYVKAMCREEESTSIIEDVGGLTTSAIISHELAHSLGAYHDGFGESSSCPADQNFLMASSASGSEFSSKFANNFLLSSCSTKQIEDFLSSPESQCLWEKRTNKEKTRLFHRSSEVIHKREKKPGELFDRNRQCMIAFGPYYGFCTNKEYYHKRGDPCRRLWCKNRKLKRFAPCETKSYLPMMDGTKCSDSQWCISGACVHNEFAIFNKRNCDDINKGYCQKQESKLELFCRKQTFKAICCETCEYFVQQTKKKNSKF